MFPDLYTFFFSVLNDHKETNKSNKNYTYLPWLIIATNGLTPIMICVDKKETNTTNFPYINLNTACDIMMHKCFGNNKEFNSEQIIKSTSLE